MITVLCSAPTFYNILFKLQINTEVPYMYTVYKPPVEANVNL